MSIERFFYEGFRNETLYDELRNSEAYPLVRELEFKYGLKVLRKTPTQTKDYNNVDGWHMVNKYGIAVGKAYVCKNDDDKTEYCFRTPYFRKQRGSSTVDKETIRSVKLSALMGTIERSGAIPSPDMMHSKKQSVLSSLIDQHRRALGDSRKDMSGWSPNDLHGLIAHYLGVTPTSGWTQIDKNKCQETLDKYEEADRVARIKLQEGKRLFLNPFYMVGVDEFGDYLIGKFRVTDHNTDRDLKVEIIEPYKRYPSYESVPDLVPVMTMVKLAYETKTEQKKINGFPVMDGYDENLDAVFYYTSSPTQYDHAFMVTSCSTQ